MTMMEDDADDGWCRRMTVPVERILARVAILTEEWFAAKQESHAHGKNGKNDKANDSTTPGEGMHGIQALEFRS
jgi:hypothetical protein